MPIALGRRIDGTKTQEAEVNWTCLAVLLKDLGPESTCQQRVRLGCSDLRETILELGAALSSLQGSIL